METVRLRTERVEPFIKATLETFKTMVHLKNVRGEIRLRKTGAVSSDVSGIIGLSGAAEGTVTLALPKRTAQAVAASFLGETEVSDALVADSIGEIVNIITGFAKQNLPEVDIHISLPTVIVGPGHRSSSHADSRKVATYFDCPLGEFRLEVYLEGLPDSLGHAYVGKT